MNSLHHDQDTKHQQQHGAGAGFAPVPPAQQGYASTGNSGLGAHQGAHEPSHARLSERGGAMNTGGGSLGGPPARPPREGGPIQHEQHHHVGQHTGGSHSDHHSSSEHSKLGGLAANYEAAPGHSIAHVGEGNGAGVAGHHDGTFGKHSSANTSSAVAPGQITEGPATAGQHKPSIGDKLVGTFETVAGKMTHNTAKVEHGQAKKAGLETGRETHGAAAAHNTPAEGRAGYKVNHPDEFDSDGARRA